MSSRFEEVVPEMDVVLDTIGGQLLRRSCAVLRPGGLLISTAEPPDATTLATYQLRGSYSQPNPNGAMLAHLLALVAANRLRTKVGKILPLDQAAVALTLAQDSCTRGKVVLQVS